MPKMLHMDACHVLFTSLCICVLPCLWLLT